MSKHPAGTGTLRVEIQSPREKQTFKGGQHGIDVPVHVSAGVSALPRHLDLFLLIDTSKSIDPKPHPKLKRITYRPLRRKIENFLVDNLPTQSRRARVGFVKFGGTMNSFSPTEDLKLVKKKLEALRGGGGTHLADGIKRAIAEFAKETAVDTSRAMVLISDGSSEEGAALEAARLAFEKGYTIHTVLLGQNDEGGRLLEKIARETQGTSVTVGKSKEDLEKLRALLSPRTVQSVELRVNEQESIRWDTPAENDLYSGSVRLLPGNNRLDAIATDTDGRTAAHTVQVTLESVKPTVPDPKEPRAHNKVVVFGAGVAGLTAAHELASRGFEVYVVEPDRGPDRNAEEGMRIGGMAKTYHRTPGRFPDPTDVGSDVEPPKIVPGEHGFRFFPSYYHHIWDTMQRIPLYDRVEAFEEAADPEPPVDEASRKIARLCEERDRILGLSLLKTRRDESDAKEIKRLEKLIEAERGGPGADRAEKFERFRDEWEELTRTYAHLGKLCDKALVEKWRVRLEISTDDVEDWRDRESAITEHMDELRTRGVELVKKSIELTRARFKLDPGRRFTPRDLEYWRSWVLALDRDRAAQQIASLRKVREEALSKPTTSILGTPIELLDQEIAKPRTAGASMTEILELEWELPEQGKLVPTHRTAFDNVTPCSTVSVIAAKEAPFFIGRRPPRSIAELMDQAQTVRDTGFAPSDLNTYAYRILRYMCSCSERREDECEDISVLDYLKGRDRKTGRERYHYSAEFLEKIAFSPRILAAMDADYGDARTNLSTQVQLLINNMIERPKVDGVLNGPTTDAWFVPWRTHLEQLGVRFIPAKLEKLALSDEGKPVATVLKRGKSADLEDEILNLSVDYFVVALDAPAAEDVTKGLPRDVGVPGQLRGFTTRVAENPPEPLEGESPTIRRDSHKMLSREGLPLETRRWDRFQTLTGIQYFFDYNFSLAHGHAYFPTAPWGLSAIVEHDFWLDQPSLQQDGFKGVLSVDIGAWNEPGGSLDSKGERHGLTAAESTSQEIAEEVWRQICDAIGDVTYERYEVKPGDELRHIAEKYYRDAKQSQRIFEANKALLNDPSEIEPGQVLRIPTSTLPTPRWYYLDENLVFGDGKLEHITKSGETLYQISEKYIRIDTDDVRENSIRDKDDKQIPIRDEHGKGIPAQPDHDRVFISKKIAVRNKCPYFIPIMGEFKNRRPGGEPWDPASATDREKYQDPNLKAEWNKEPQGNGPVPRPVWQAKHGGYWVHWDKLVFAGTYKKTFTRLTSMEAACESGRHAVNSIIDHYLYKESGGKDLRGGTGVDWKTPAGFTTDRFSSPEFQSTPIGHYCQIWNIEEDELPNLEFAKRVDQWFYEKNLKHPWDEMRLDDLASLSSSLAPLFEGLASPAARLIKTLASPSPSGSLFDQLLKSGVSGAGLLPSLDVASLLPVLTSLREALEKLAKGSGPLQAVFPATVRFPTSGTQPDEHAMARCTEIATVLQHYPWQSVLVTGYSDSSGDAAANLKLSRDRAECVVELLVERGVERTRLEANGLGVKDPVTTNETKEGRAKNRRVVLSVKP